jgi:hypothetical protein
MMGAYKLYGMPPWCEILREHEELPPRLLQGVKRLRNAPVDAKLNIVKIDRRFGKNRDYAGTGPVKRDAARSARSIPACTTGLVETPAPALIADRVKRGGVAPVDALERI